MEGFVKVKTISSNATHERLNAVVNITSISHITEAGEEYTKIGGSSFLNLFNGTCMLLEDHYEDVLAEMEKNKEKKL